jgi:hypothetical protein
MWDFYWTFLVLKQDYSEQLVSLISIIPPISQIKIAFPYPQNHTVFRLSLNTEILSFSLQDFQSAPLCAGSNSFITNINFIK